MKWLTLILLVSLFIVVGAASESAQPSARYLPYVERGLQTATTTPTVTLTPRPTLGPACNVVVAGIDSRHLWHAISELEYLGMDAYPYGVYGGTEIGLGVSARQPACDALATLYRGAGFDVEVWP